MRQQRRIEIGMASPRTDETPKERNAQFEHRVHVVTRVIEKSIFKIGVAVCAYVVLDTARQVAVKGFVPD